MPVKEQKRRGLKPFARAAVLTAMGAALVGGVASQGVAAAEGRPDNNSWTELDKRPGTPDRMHFKVNKKEGKVLPGERATVSVEWDLWNIWTTFQADKAGKGQLNAAQDLVKLFAWQTANITLNGETCADFGRGQQPATQKFERGKKEGGFNFEPVDVGGLVAQVRNLFADLASGVIGENVVSDFFNSNVRATCEFTVPENPGRMINVGGDVALNNLFGLLRSNQKGLAYLPVQLPKAPGKPTIAPAGNTVDLPEGGELTGKADPGTTVRFKVDGTAYPEPSVVADAQGTWKLRLPSDLKAGQTHLIQATSQKLEGGPAAASDPKIVNVKSGDDPAPHVKQPVITSPEGDTVKPGQELTVTGSDGSVVTPVDKDGKPVGPSVEVKDGQAKVTLNDDLPNGAKVRVEAKAKDGSGQPKFSDEKTVQAGVDKPVITSPAGDVRPGDELTVTGSDGSVVTAVDQDGKQIGGPVEIKDGKAKITLPNNLKDGSQVKVVAKPKEGSGDPVSSDPKTVRAEKPEFYQNVVPTAKPGENSYLDVNFEPKNGDVTSIAGKTVTLRAPEGFTFGNVSYVVVGHNGIGKGIGINNLVQRNDDGTLAVTLPPAEEMKATFGDDIKAFKLSITAIAKVDASATPGEKAVGEAKLDGFTPVPLKGTVVEK
ncbi:hypothetical protein FB471_0190 [Amycolatopsis cihanbeyliensis]|uniref:Bacterial Ig domain-containing protein n=2 Tax=Amycolatopsis cihanbeyliensis TaxID=1128664 RepID=A0A542DBW0_AMYCI|nr:hypothetical protein FB471_0190 [Amycolatopsis cihanbeyliensis]